MTSDPTQSRRVLIASANPLFREGLRKVYAERWGDRAQIVAMTASLEETLAALAVHHPELVIIDHDDRGMQRGEFLMRFVTDQSPMRVVLVSLGSSETVVVYDRWQLTSAEAETWLSDPWKDD